MLTTLALAFVVVAPAKVHLPSGVKATGTVLAMEEAADADGDHVYFVEKVAKKTGPELHAYGYVSKGGKWVKQWQANDFVRDCDFDAILELKQLAVEDVNADGKSEVIVAYEIACVSDVSPHGLKVLLYSGDTKYALRGSTKVDVGGGTFEGGTYEADPSIPPAFADFLKKRWARLIGP